MSAGAKQFKARGILLLLFKSISTVSKET